MEDSPKPEGATAPSRDVSASPDGATPSPGLPDDASPGDRPFAFGANLEPVLLKTCHGRLSDVSWFRTDWQRGGALTGYATWKDDNDEPKQAVVKLPVRPRELLWLRQLGEHGDVAPLLYASGDTLNGYDMAWVVMERLPHGPLGMHWEGREFDLVVDAIGRFYAAAQHVPVEGHHQHRDWEAICQRSRDAVHKSGIPHEQRWNNALKKAKKKLKQWLADWRDRPTDAWCHGDLHLANAMTREPAPEGPALLLDFAEARPGFWVEDAVYFEHLFWARRDRLDDRKLCSMIAKKRKEHGLDVDEHWPHFAEIKRALLAMSVPVDLKNCDYAHMEASLQLLEAAV